MITEIGFGTLFLVFILCGYGIFSSLYGWIFHKPAWIQSARSTLLTVFPALSISVLILWGLLISGHYEVHYVYTVSGEGMPFYLKITALWGGQAGSLLFWTWLLSLFGFLVMLRNWEKDSDYLPWVMGLLFFILLFFVGLVTFLENPFLRYWQMPGGSQVIALFKPAEGVLIQPSDGRGLNPLLRHPGMVFHPPALYLGFTAFVIPFVFGLSHLILGRRDARWLEISRPWTILAWVFLSAGLLLGSRWAYDVLGWGGYWGWDPVENAALMPWLLGTAFIHGAMVQKKLNIFKRWNMILVLLVFSMVLFGTFLTRSGIFSSVHAFTENTLGPAFFIFIGFSLIISMGLIFYRWGDLSGEANLYSLFSRESLLLSSTVLFFALFLIVLLGVVFPLASELITQQKISVGPVWYKKTTGPLFAGILFLMSILPTTIWRYSTGKTVWKALRLPLLATLILCCSWYLMGVRQWEALFGYGLVVLFFMELLFDFGTTFRARRKQVQEFWGSSMLAVLVFHRRRLGSLIIHSSIILMTLGILGIELAQMETQAKLKPGETVMIGAYTVQLESIDEFEMNDGRNISRAVIHVLKDDLPVGTMYPRRDYYYAMQQSVTIPGIYSTLNSDLYVVLVDWEPINSNQATFKVYLNPMMNWLWIGGLGLLIGGGILLGSRAKKKPMGI